MRWQAKSTNHSDEFLYLAGRQGETIKSPGTVIDPLLAERRRGSQPAKKDQYKRWRELRKMQEASTKPEKP